MMITLGANSSTDEEVNKNKIKKTPSTSSKKIVSIADSFDLVTDSGLSLTKKSLSGHYDQKSATAILENGLIKSPVIHRHPSNPSAAAGNHHHQRDQHTRASDLKKSYKKLAETLSIMMDKSNGGHHAKATLDSDDEDTLNLSSLKDTLSLRNYDRISGVKADSASHDNVPIFILAKNNKTNNSFTAADRVFTATTTNPKLSYLRQLQQNELKSLRNYHYLKKFTSNGTHHRDSSASDATSLPDSSSSVVGAASNVKYKVSNVSEDGNQQVEILILFKFCFCRLE